MAQVIITDGSNTKALNPWDLDANPEAWTFLSNAPQSELDAMFYKVAASFRAVNKRATAASEVPFAIMRGKTEVDNSKLWENKVGFLPKPKDLIKRISLSLTFHNKAYLLTGKNMLGAKKSLNFLIPTTIRELVSAEGFLTGYERNVNGKTIKYGADDLIRIWLLDHKTELLPSEFTAAQAIFNSVGGIYFQDLFVRNFFERGGVAPTVLALKGAVFNEKKEDIERGWSRFLRNLSRFSSKIFNAETMDVKTIGAGVDSFKNNEIYKQGLENIALGVGMPISELMSDFDSFATANVDRMSWQRDDIFPLCEVIAEELNEQVFIPLGMRLDFKTETTDAETQDEVDRSKAYSEYVAAGIKPSVAAQIVSIELPEGVEFEDLDKMAEEKKKEEDAKAQADRDQALALQAAKQPVAEKPAAEPKSTSRWVPTVDEVKEMGVWRDVALRRFKKGDGLDFEYNPHYGGLPVPLTIAISAALSHAESAEAIKAAFELDPFTETQAQEYQSSDIILLADALNKLAAKSVTETPPPQIVINNRTEVRPRPSMASAFANTVFAKKPPVQDAAAT